MNSLASNPAPRFRLWNNWSIRQRLLFITLLPVSYLFCMLVWHSYWSHGREVDNEIDERGKIISQLLAKSSEYELAANRLSELRLSLDNLIQSEKSIVSIDILGPDKKSLLHSQSTEPGQLHRTGFETPIVKRVMWIDVLPDQAGAGAGNRAENVGPQSRRNTQLVGYVYVVMSPTYLQKIQQERFAWELLVAALGLAMSGGLAVQLSRNLSASLKTFIVACRAVRAAQYPVHIDVSSGGEIGELQASINDMARSLQQSTHELESKVTQRTRELESSRNEALRANDEKRKLIQKVQHIVEEERKSIAIEVHDELNAALITARLQAQRIAELSDAISTVPQSAEIKQHALSIKQIARTLYDNGRALVRRLRPEVLDMLGLSGALSEMVASYNNAHSGCHFSCDVDGDFSRLDNAAAMSVYRIVQEALSNSIKHANASEARVVLKMDAHKNSVVIDISDDGTGFVQLQDTEGIGLIGMRERVFALGGTMEITSPVDHERGTLITIRFDALPANRTS